MQCTSQMNAHRSKHLRMEKNKSVTHSITGKRKLKDDALNPHVHRHLAYMLMKNVTLGYKRTFPAALEHLETAVDWTH